MLIILNEIIEVSSIMVTMGFDTDEDTSEIELDVDMSLVVLKLFSTIFQISVLDCKAIY